jgi:hypothetical protein
MSNLPDYEPTRTEDEGHALIRRKLKLVPITWNPGDVLVVSADGTPYAIGAALVPTVVRQLAGDAALVALGQLRVGPGEAAVLVLDGQRVGLTTIAFRRMQTGGEA